MAPLPPGGLGEGPDFYSQLKSFGSSSKDSEIGPESCGILVCRFVGTVPCILGLALRSYRPKSDSKSKISGRILKSFRALSAEAENIRSQIYVVLGPGSLGPDLGPISSALRPKPPPEALRPFSSALGPKHYKTTYRSASGPEIGFPGRMFGRSEAGRASKSAPAGGPILRLFRLDSGRHPARKPDFRPGSASE